VERGKGVSRARRGDDATASGWSSAELGSVHTHTLRAGRSGRTSATSPQLLHVDCQEGNADTAIVRFLRPPPRGDRRHSLRRRVRLAVELEGDHRRRAHTEDVSVGGLFVVTDHLRTVGSRVRLRLKVRGRTEELVGKVCWIRTQGEDGRSRREARGLGLKIISLSSKGKTAFAALLRGDR